MLVAIECICPPKADGEPRHPDGDTVTLRDRLDFRATVTARHAMTLAQAGEGVTAADMLAVLTETYLTLGIEAWTLADAKGRPLPVSRAAIAETLLVNVDTAMVVADAADELYTPTVLLPLVERASTSSPTSPTPEPTSATITTLPRPPKPSRRSSTTTTPTDATETTQRSLAGASS